MEKDNIDLICSVAELSGLFEKRSDLGGFLQDVVELVAQHMLSDVCSIYLYDEAEEKLVLRATRGLNPDSVGRVRLRIGEGLTGLSLEQRRPVRVDRAEEHPSFKVVPELKEEEYQSFLAVPIRRGLVRIGVIALQHRRAGYFSEHDAKALRAIASQLAATLENASLLMDIHAEGEKERARLHGVEEIGTLVGRSAGPSIGWGEATHLDGAAHVWAPEPPRLESVSQEVERFEAALERARSQLEELQVDAERRYSDVAGLIFSSHLLILRDEEFSGRMLDAVQEGMSPVAAVQMVVGRFVELFGGNGETRLKEKAQDVQDLGHRILRNLVSDETDHGDYTGQVVISRDIFPSELVKLAAQHVEGLVLSGAAATSHVSILARSLGLPLVFVRDNRVFEIPERTPLIVDGVNGQVLVAPEEETRNRYREQIGELNAETAAGGVPEEAVTQCGTRMQVMANVNLVADVDVAKANCADGIGLYRSEFPFLVRKDFPSEEEQYYIYRSVVGAMAGREIVLRTLDIGGDKLLDADVDNQEANPFLGMRGIRFSLANPDLFRDQLRAMLRAGAGAGTSLRIMFPMVSSVDEFQQAEQLLEECKEELRREGLEFNEHALVGAMIELPSAIESAGVLSREADFLSVGTNDLVMYLLGVDRTNERVGKLYVHHHPAVLRAIARLVDSLGDGRAELAVCGEAASDPVMVPFFLGLGIRRLSVEPRYIPRVKRQIAAMDLEFARRRARQMLTIASVSEMNEFVAELREAGCERSVNQAGADGPATG